MKSIAPKNVLNLYSSTSISLFAGFSDYTDGIYHGDSLTPYEVAQKNQHNYLLDELGAGKGFKLLDIGCGLGTLLETARERGVIGTGITISEDQVQKCKAKKLDVHLLNYQSLPRDWDGTFDGIIANGSLEHFCQPEDALIGNQDKIYREMFGIFHRLLNQKLRGRKAVTTAIHFNGPKIDPKKCLKNPFLQLLDNKGFHFSILYRGYGGYYPEKGQLEKNAKSCFALKKEVDGTEDYGFTSKYWCNAIKSALLNNKEFKAHLFRALLKRPIHTFWLAMSIIGAESWPWQFRGKNPPTRLYRQTWEII